jgi:DNA repair protein RecN (Recombination protein N)
MLLGFSVRGMALIGDLDVTLRPGLNVLTGETGAGKSILLDCLGLALGWPGRTESLRAGQAGEVTAEFHLPSGHPARGFLDEAGLPSGEELLLRRSFSAEGRLTAYANDRKIAAESLRDLAGHLIELHGQRDDRGLLDPRRHRLALDDFADAAGTLAGVAEAWRIREKASRALEQAREGEKTAARDAEFLAHAQAELARIAPETGEEVRLDTDRRLMRAAARIRDEVAAARTALGSDGALGLLQGALRRLDNVAGAAEGALDEGLAALERGAGELAEAEAVLDEVLMRLNADPSALEACEERLFALRGLARKHGVTPDELPGLLRSMTARLDALGDGAARLRRLEAELTEAETTYRAAAEKLTMVRTLAARDLDRAMTAELPPLRLDRARFVTEVAPAEPGPSGADRVTFRVAPNPGLPPGPVNAIASGGELSRFLLALKVALHGAGGAASMIFDEIDRGVGGATADAVGRRLAVLAERAQILAVTHSPQVAARASHHLRVGKESTDRGDRTTLAVVEAQEREEELARMLAGEAVTEAARAAARALLAG